MRIEEIGDPYGILFLTGFISPQVPLRYTATSWSERKFAVHFTSLRRIQCFFISLRRFSWLTKLK